jgi:hypothetical protein
VQERSTINETLLLLAAVVRRLDVLPAETTEALLGFDAVKPKQLLLRFRVAPKAVPSETMICTRDEELELSMSRQLDHLGQERPTRSKRRTFVRLLSFCAFGDTRGKAASVTPITPIELANLFRIVSGNARKESNVLLSVGATAQVDWLGLLVRTDVECVKDKSNGLEEPTNLMTRC